MYWWRLAHIRFLKVSINGLSHITSRLYHITSSLSRIVTNSILWLVMLEKVDIGHRWEGRLRDGGWRFTRLWLAVQRCMGKINIRLYWRGSHLRRGGRFTRYNGGLGGRGLQCPIWDKWLCRERGKSEVMFVCVPVGVTDILGS